MMGPQRIVSVVGVGAALALLVAGCSSGTGSPGSESAAALTTGQTPEQSPTATGPSAPSSGPSTTSSATAGGMSGMAMSGTASENAASGGDAVAQARLATPQGQQVGTVTFAVNGSVVTVTAQVEGLPAGFKGFHVHSIGKCEPNSPNPTDPSKVGDFLSAGGHLGSATAAHPGHQGDLTALEVRGDGSAELVTSTDAFDMDSVLDADGSAVMVHAGPDNFGNIPTRYAPTGPDADTQATGDSGGRAACGVVTAVSG
jgi:superoxide dismutase, Cu-Zn family